VVQKLKIQNSGKTIIGITGTFGSGKSTVANFFRELGAEVVDADKLAHEALMEGSTIFDRIRATFQDAYSASQKGMNHKKLSEIVFGNEAKRKKLESIIHPYVFERITEEVNSAKEKIIILEIPLLFESGFDKFCDQVGVVTASEEVIQKRLESDGFSPEEIDRRQKAQMPLKEKETKANFVIDNSNDFQKTRGEVESLWKKFHPASKGAA